MKISSNFVGYLRIIGIVGKISSVQDKISIWGKINFEKIPIKMDNTSQKQDYDRKLEIQILPPATSIQASVTDLPKEVLCGEIFEASLEIYNSGDTPISDVYISTNSPREIILNTLDMPLSIAKGKINLLESKSLEVNLVLF
jgi:uncharacterized membrane protein